MWRWIFAIIGYFITHSFWGAIVGYFIGQMFDNSQQNKEDGQNHWFSSSSKDESSTRDNSSSSYSSSSTDSAYQANNSARSQFLESLLELSAYVVAADGKIMHSELEYVRAFLRASFDERTMTICNKRMLAIFEERKQMTPNMIWQNVFTSCQHIRYTMNQETCLQLLAYLAEIAKADGKVTADEIEVLRKIARALGLLPSAVDQLLSLGGQTLEDAYKVLGLTPDATDDEVRKAYRKMALQYHPDRVATLGDDIKESATKKFQEINDAKDRIFKARGL